MHPVVTVKSRAREVLEGGTGLYSLMAMLIGALVVICAFFLGHYHEPPRIIIADILREFGLVLVSVFGISYLYEKLSAEQQFRKFYGDLQQLIRQGESNAAMCAALGILEIHATRRSYEERHSFSRRIGELKAGDRVRIFGRSLIFTMYSWKNLKTMLESGAALELCLCDPEMDATQLEYLAGYSHEETLFALHRFLSGVQAWLREASPAGSVEVRLHRVHLLDSLVEIAQGNTEQVAWDLNFGEGTQARQVLLLDGKRELGRNLLLHRYNLIWERATPAFRYRDRQVEVDTLNAAQLAAPTGPV